MLDRDVRQPGWRGVLPRPPSQLGFRGRALLMLGVVWCLIGLGVVGEPSTPGVWHHTWPDWVRIAMWVGCGATAVVFAWRPKGASDAIGWVALYLPPAVRAVSFLVAWSDYLLPLGGAGFARGWVSALIYGAMVAMVTLLSRWPEPPLRAAPVPREAP